LDWDIIESMGAVARRFSGVPGVILHVGDSNTLEPAYAAWALLGKAKTSAEIALLGWMHAGKGGDLDGWSLCSTPVGSKWSATAAGGIQLRQLLRGEGVLPAYPEIIRKYNPQIVVLMIGTNDVTVQRSVKDFAHDLRQVVDLTLKNGTVPLLTTLPPHAGGSGLLKKYNEVVHSLAREKRLPLVDLYGEIFRRRPNNWREMLMEKDGFHLTNGLAAEPLTDGNAAASGQMLRTWLTIKAISEVKYLALDKINS